MSSPRIKPVLIRQKPKLIRPVPARQVVVQDTRGDRVIAFAEEFCRVPDGPDVGKKIVLRPWQKSIIKEIYDGEDEKGFRLVHEAVVTMGRKNSKTATASILVLAHLIGPEAVRNSRIYSAAYDREQASIVYNNVANMVMLDRYLNSQIKLADSYREARWFKMGVTYKALSAESRTKHGLNPTFVVLDELGQFGGNRDLYDVLKTSMGVQLEPLMLVISTQAEDDAALMSQLVDYGRSINCGDIVDPRFKLFEYSVPDDKDIYDEKNWYLANPALGDFRRLDEMRSMAERAKLLPSVARKFENLYLNRRVSMSVTAITREAWLRGKRPLPPLEVLQQCRAFMGVDLSSKLDLTALVIAFELPEEEWAVLPHFFTPKDTMIDRAKIDRIPYLDWHGMGFLEAPEGAAIDYTVVAARMIEYFQTFNVICCAFDRWRMDVLKKELERLGWDCEDGPVGFLEFGQGYRDMSPALETLEQTLVEGRLIHGGHPVLTFNVSSAVSVQDEAGNRKLDKRNSRAKIDGMVSMVMALHSVNRLDEIGYTGPSVYEGRGLRGVTATAGDDFGVQRDPEAEAEEDQLPLISGLRSLGARRPDLGDEL